LEILADEHKIDQVLVNLVNNAVKYAPHSMEIIMEVRVFESFIKVLVTDHGNGIADENKASLFDRYYRVDHHNLRRSGLGLGLYICAEIIKRHGGEIGVDSVVGQGASFWFTIPIEETI
jgi:signal transduction histidine kinase